MISIITKQESVRKRTWRRRANDLEAYAPSAARAFRVAADELEADVRDEEQRVVTLSEAARLNGYCREHLGCLVKDGTIPNAGRPNAPRIRLSDLPRKAGYLPPERVPEQLSGTSNGQIVRSIVEAQKGSRRWPNPRAGAIARVPEARIGSARPSFGGSVVSIQPFSMDTVAGCTG
jgi:hypothetical protein